MNNQIAKKGLPTYALVKHEAQLNNLAPAERKIIEAGLQAKISNIPRVLLIEEVIKTLGVIYTIVGQKPEIETLCIYANEFMTVLLEQYPKATIDEVKAALRKGIYADRDEKNQYFGLNVKTFVMFMREYLYSEERKAAKKVFDDVRALPDSESDTTFEQSNQDKKEFVNYYYQLYLNKTLLTDYMPAFIFDFLEAEKLIDLSKEQKREIKTRAHSYYIRLMSAERFAQSVKPMGNNVKKMIQGVSPVKIIARQFAVSDFFETKAAEGASIIFQI
jgi:hypothetical protein